MLIRLRRPPSPHLLRNRSLHLAVGVPRTMALATPPFRHRLQQETIAAPAEDLSSLFPTPLPKRRRTARYDAGDDGVLTGHAKILAAAHGLGFLDDDRMLSALACPPAAAPVAPSSPADHEVTPAGGEEVDQNAARLSLELGTFYMPKKGKEPLGEDAHFVSKALDAFGVADGVGGWTKRGVDAGEFARQLMSLCEDELMAAASCRGTATAETALEGVLERALARTTARGTSTACIGVLDGRFLRAVNVGDSGFLVVRGDDVVHRSAPQQKGFNRPYQVGRVDSADPPEVASRICVEMEAGDIIVAGSDGLFDNLFDAEIVDALVRAKEEGNWTPQEMAGAVGLAAVKAYLVGEETPFSLACREAKYRWSGGKPDDVTVVVATVW